MAKEVCMTYGTLLPVAYPPTSKLLHWLVAISVLVQAPLGLLIVHTELGAWRDASYNFHKSLGILILALMLWRLVNRFVAGAPRAEPTIAAWQRVVSSAVHGALYLLLIVQPIIGYLANSAFGASTPVFGLFEIPPAVAENGDRANRLFALHGWIGLALLVLIAVHVAAALQHYFVRKDGVLQRMLPKRFGGRALSDPLPPGLHSDTR
jgi:cytochrome b561